MAESRFLQSLSLDLRTKVEGDVESVELGRGEVIQPVGRPIDYVYFPLDCLISLVVTLETGSTIEAATVGSDGYAGVAAFLGAAQTDVSAIVQIPGQAYRMRLADFHERMGASPEFRDKLGTYAARVLATVTRSTACIAFHPVNERLARWLLLVRDATDKNEFHLTQDLLATMLGVHRPTVTIAVRILESAGVIRHRRGLIRIVDGPALEEAACECYRASQRLR